MTTTGVTDHSGFVETLDSGDRFLARLRDEVPGLTRLDLSLDTPLSSPGPLDSIQRSLVFEHLRIWAHNPPGEVLAELHTLGDAAALCELRTPGHAAPAESVIDPAPTGSLTTGTALRPLVPDDLPAHRRSGVRRLVHNCRVGYSWINDGTHVLGAQNVMRSWLAYSGSLDGEFGSGSYSALRSYQGAKNLAQDGVAGQATWKNMEADCQDREYLGFDTIFGCGFDAHPGRFQVESNDWLINTGGTDPYSGSWKVWVKP